MAMYRVPIAAVVAVLVWTAMPLTAAADRFGPPFEASVTVDAAHVYVEPNDASPAVGALSKNAVAAVLEERGEWLRIPDGWLRSADIAERTEPWLAQVDDGTSVYAKPNAQSEIRRSATPSDLLIVTGLSKGVDGDANVWWATTEGYVALRGMRQANPDLVREWRLPTAADTRESWWGEAHAANVRVGPTTEAVSLGEFHGGEHVKVLGTVGGEDVNGNADWYRIDGGRYPGGFVHASLVDRVAQPEPTVAPPPASRELGDRPWLVVDRSAHTLTTLRNGQPTFTTFVAIGRAGKETPDGAYPTFLKYAVDRMSSATVTDAAGSYDLPNVPFPQYFKDDGSAIHGTYWHDAFGSDESQGCINVTWADSAYLFAQTEGRIGEGEFRVQTSPEEATPLIILH